MEMDSNPITKPSKKGAILSAVFYALAAVLLITAFVSLVACHQNISRQLEQGVPVQGNELAIVNLYLTSCVQYFAFAAAMVFCGKAAPKMLALKNEMSNYNNSLRSIRDVLLDNENYVRCPLYRRLQRDITRYITRTILDMKRRGEIQGDSYLTVLRNLRDVQR